MGNYDQLKTAVEAVIYDNGAEYITGDRLQYVLKTIIDSVGAGATFKGVALPNTDPGIPDPNMFYLAGKAGTYTNFNVTITKGLWVFTNNGGTWTGTDLQVSMLFATGEDVTDTSITDDLTQGSPGSLPTTSAVLGALEAEDEKFFNEVAYGDIDDLATFDEAFAGSESGTPAYYTVYVMVSTHKVKVGTMEIISDNMAHVVTQVMVTHYVLDENGAITGAHSDGDLFRIFRSKKIHGGTLPTDDWTPWAYVNETEWKKIVSGADAVPTPDSTNVVKSGGVAAAIESLEAADDAIQGTFFNEVAYEDLNNIKLYIDTLAGSQSGTPAYYTVYKAVGDDKVKVGTLQVISDSSRGVLTQILETHYTLNENGSLTAVVDDDHTFRIARSVTYSGGLVSLWSPWSYVNGSIVDEAVADAAESLGNVNYLLAGCKKNVFDKTYVRVGKGIRNVDVTNHGEVVDEENACITCYYRIPDNAEILSLSGASTTSSLKIRFTSAPVDDIDNVGNVENVYVQYVNAQAYSDVNLIAFRADHPTLKYFCCYVYRGAGQEGALDTMKIEFKTVEERKAEVDKTAFVNIQSEIDGSVFDMGKASVTSDITVVADGTWATASGTTCYMFAVTPGTPYLIKTGVNEEAKFAFLTSSDFPTDASQGNLTGPIYYQRGSWNEETQQYDASEAIRTSPSDAKFVAIFTNETYAFPEFNVASNLDDRVSAIEGNSTLEVSDAMNLNGGFIRMDNGYPYANPTHFYYSGLFPFDKDYDIYAYGIGQALANDCCAIAFYSSKDRGDFLGYIDIANYTSDNITHIPASAITGTLVDATYVSFSIKKDFRDFFMYANSPSAFSNLFRHVLALQGGGGGEVVNVVGMPEKIYMLAGTTMELFKSNIACVVDPSAYEMKIEKGTNANVGKNCDQKFVYSVNTNNPDFVAKFGVANEHGEMMAANTTQFIHVAKKSSPANNKNVLVIGDSFTNLNYYVSELRRLLTGTVTVGYSDTAESPIAADALNNITFIGTRMENATPCEGYSGMHYGFFATDNYTWGQEQLHNPFWDGSKVDFTWYCQQHEYSGGIDIAIILLGTNGNNDEVYVKTVWNALLAHNPNIKVLIAGRCFSAHGPGAKAGMSANQTFLSLSRGVNALNKTFEGYCKENAYKNNFLYVDYNVQMDCEHNFPYIEVDANQRNTTDKVLQANDNVHPSNKGYWQIADALRAAFHYWCL